MSAHTPGPWWARKNSAGDWDVQTLRDSYPDMPEGSDTGAYIASVYNDTTDSRTRGKNEANARLIAAAPELLDAANAALDAMTDERADDEYKKMAVSLLRAAITKAV